MPGRELFAPLPPYSTSKTRTGDALSNRGHRGGPAQEWCGGAHQPTVQQVRYPSQSPLHDSQNLLLAQISQQFTFSRCCRDAVMTESPPAVRSPGTELSLPATPPPVAIAFRSRRTSGPGNQRPRQVVAKSRGPGRLALHRSEERGQDRKVKRLLLHVFAERRLGDDLLTRQADGRRIGLDHQRAEVVGDAQAGAERNAAQVGAGLVGRPADEVLAEMGLDHEAAQRAGIDISGAVRRDVAGNG